MTTEKAIEIIKKCKEKRFKHTFYTVNEYEAALDMAIKALRREDTFLDKVFEIIDNSIEDVEALTTGREGAVSEERKEGMLLEARVIRISVEALRGE